jgi:hypothetical protein
MNSFQPFNEFMVIFIDCIFDNVVNQMCSYSFLTQQFFLLVIQDFMHLLIR